MPDTPIRAAAEGLPPTDRQRAADAFHAACDMETPLRTVRDLVRALHLMVTGDMDQQDAAPIGTIAIIMSKELDALEEKRGSIFDRCHPAAFPSWAEKA